MFFAGGESLKKQHGQHRIESKLANE